jgi:L-seryl-tRNA(Ser) seleniumtransferase
VIDDIGSGALVDFAQFGFQGEPVASQSVAAGADLVLFSGDKLLGGPQAGIIVGKTEWIQKIEKDPLMRAFRLDKMTLAALETTLRLYLNTAQVMQSIPVLRLLSLPLTELQQRAQTLATRLAQLPGIVEAHAEKADAYVGGGSLPDQAMPTWVVKLRASQVTEEQLSYRLRTGRWAVLARAQEGRLILDLRTIFPEQIEPLVGLLGEALRT